MSFNSKRLWDWIIIVLIVGIVSLFGALLYLTAPKPSNEFVSKVDSNRLIRKERADLSNNIDEDVVLPINTDQSDDRPYTIEVLVGVDSTMPESHGEKYKEYVLMLVVMASSRFADASIGNSINLAVIEIKLFNNIEYPSNLSDSAHVMLDQFCDIVQENRLHYDAALLLTRYLISIDIQHNEFLSFDHLNIFVK